jgi:cold-inducible RNA-binding protein
LNIYVGSLSSDVTKEDLKKTFEAFGHVEYAKIITDMDNGQSKGFGFVKMPNRSEAQFAINKLNSKELKGRMLKVSKARSRSQSRRDGGRQDYRRYFYY